jgi:hypothetical protein
MAQVIPNILTASNFHFPLKFFEDNVKRLGAFHLIDSDSWMKQLLFKVKTHKWQQNALQHDFGFDDFGHLLKPTQV